MKILILQLARFGDIYQSWPVLFALRRQWPEARIDLMVRERFKEAATPLENLGFGVLTFRTAFYLQSAYQGQGDLEQMSQRVEGDLAIWQATGYDKIINLSFSPLSSFMVDAVAAEHSEVRGYARHSDGFLNIPDDPSAYFYAQVGIRKSNRYHLTDVFAAVAGVDLVPEDFRHPESGVARTGAVIVHLGASQAQKVYPPELWVEVLRSLTLRQSGPFILVGSASEAAMAERVASEVGRDEVVVRVGQSTLTDLSKWICEASLVIGADSAPLQIASLTGTKSLNLSCAEVNFFETGPLTPGSLVLWAPTMADLPPERIVRAASCLLSNKNYDEQGDSKPYALRGSREEGYLLRHFPTEKEFGWKLVQALYTPADYPILEPGAQGTLDFQRLYEAAALGVELYSRWRDSGPTPQLANLVTSLDMILEQLPVQAPRVAPIIAWFQTERLRIGPGTAEVILARTLDLFEQLFTIARLYHSAPETDASVSAVERTIAAIAPALREYKFAAVEGEFSKLLSTLHNLAAHSTKVGWSSVLEKLSKSLANRDYIETADILEFELLTAIRGLISPDETKAQDVII